MNDTQIKRLAHVVRPIWRRRIPVLYRVSKWIVSACCPKGTSGNSRSLVAPFEGGLIHVDTSSSIEYHLLFRGCHEPVITDLITRYVMAGNVCLDVGANVGAHTLIMAQAVGSNGRVIALEPHPQIAERLRANVELNHAEHVEVLEVALSDRDATTDFYGVDDAEFNKGVSSLEAGEGAHEKMTVRTLSGASLIDQAQLTRCDFIKIDVEGHEAIVIQQLWPLMEQYQPTLIFEYRKAHWSRFGKEPEEILGRLRQLGYRLQCIHKRAITDLPSLIPDSCEILATKRP